MSGIRSSPLGKTLLEAAIIIFSILLAFAIDAAWENRNERRAEERALRTLAAEFAANAAEFRSSLVWLERNRAGALHLLDAIRSAPPGTATAVSDSILVNTLLVASAMLWSNDVPPLVGGTSLFGALGYAVSIFLGWRLLRAIRASGDIRSKD